MKVNSNIIAWVSNIFVLLGTYLTAIDYIPLNKLIMIVATFGWFIVGILWKKYSVASINIIMTIIYFYGYMNG